MDGATESGAASSPVVVFKRKRGRASQGTSSTLTNVATSSQAGPSGASRAHSDSGSSRSDSESGSTVVIKKKRRSANPLVQSTGRVYRKLKLSGSLDGEKENSVDADESGDAGLTSSSIASSSLQKMREDATRNSDWDLDTAGTLKETGVTSNSDGLYRGAKSYASFTRTRDDGCSSKMRSRGPIRQTTTVRTTSLIDYQPDVCKDYKETGYCGFGDTCKFLHDRSDYLAGWQLDVLPNSSSRTRENMLSDPEDSDTEDDIPFACLICRKAFTDPVVTRCAHYFCSSCAIKRFAKNSKCFACGQQTGGLFNSAKKVLERMDKLKQQKAQLRREKHEWLQDPQPTHQLATAGDSDVD
ncbi:U2-type spliceosomal complex subunit CWC24 [Mycosarcoma maydis]|uniref:Pre-mRNA-splicing factor CWC24 n=1 Tax=Mycosarcoma maydis TaxID=5270 RepID=CWC24_MYCMD|nr:U2-type spliceosomal complex subunit CWC24 [Ustilago maydis 521]Q4P400.1 RecName: Full=Pre-mRNA-splicing factor CWC24 [Ustilago maydis 521]KIS70090.1 hypothetical protein UMAG_05163 [Ustilago maydis 521]|eukprot:XP_011388219.1 hypothetical protein UMAG_05163 [Ustilago maydis 521]